MEDKFIDNGVNLRKDKWGYRLIYPIKNKDGSINWFNLITGGSWASLIKTSLLVALLVCSVLMYNRDIANLTAYYKSICWDFPIV